MRAGMVMSRSGFTALGMVCALQAFAQALPVPAEDPAQRLLREQRQRDVEREAVQPAPQIDRPAVPPADVAVDDLAESSATFMVERIEVRGNTVLSDEAIAEITAPFLHKRLGSNRINLLLRRFTEAFVAHGYITTRAYLGEQNLASGNLIITVVPGKVEAIQLNDRPIRPNKGGLFDTVGGGLLTDAGTAWQFPAPGDTLQLQALEQGVDQINRLRRNRAELQILPGQSPGGSVVALSNPYGDRFRFNVGADNYGSRSTGISRTRVGIDADNVLGFQEAISASYVGTVDTNAAVVSAAVPFGFNTFSYTGSLSEYQNTIGDTALLYGRSSGHTVGWNRVISRSQQGRHALDLTLTHRKSEREVNSLALDPQRLTVLRGAWSGLRRFVLNGQPGYATAEIGVSRGLTAVKATRDPADIRRDEAHAQFTKVDGNVSMQLPLAPTAQARLAWRPQLVGQWTNVALFGSEQIFAGGTSTVRGFREGVIAGDRGAYLRNEMVWANAPAIAGLRMEPYLFLDGGVTEYVATRQWQAVAGTGAGVRVAVQWAGQTISGELLLGAPLAQPSYLGASQVLLLATLNWTY